MATAPTSRLPAGMWIADPDGSRIGFSVEHATLGAVRGRFERFEVRLAVAEDGCASIRGTVAAGSIATAGGSGHGDPTSADGLDAARHPELTFASTFLRRDADRLEVDGMLTVKGRALLVVALGTVAEAGAGRLRLELSTAVDRRQFGLDWNFDLPGGVPAFGNEVTIETTLSLIEQRP